MFFTCRIQCLADISSISPSSEQTGNENKVNEKLRNCLGHYS